MIKIGNTETYGWQHAIRGMRNPMNSWDKSDSRWAYLPGEGETPVWGENEVYCIGPNDKELMLKLRNAGTDHRKFMRMIVVYADITAPLYWWKEYDTYKVGTVANSCSTMHKITEKEFSLEDFSCDHMTKGSMDILRTTIDQLNDLRNWYLKYDSMLEKDLDKDITCKKDLWWQIIQLLPSSYNQKRSVMLNYEALANMYKSRKDHKLDEWRTFCKWCENLPLSELITGETK